MIAIINRQAITSIKCRMKKPEVTIQYFIDRGRRRTLTLSVQRLNTILIAGLVGALWSLAATGYVVYHLINGGSAVTNGLVTRKTVVAVGPNQPGKDIGLTVPGTTSDLRLSAKSLLTLPTATPPEVAAPSSAKAETAAVDQISAVPVAVTEIPQYSLTNLMRFEAALKKTQTTGPLGFKNVRILLKDDHLRISVDIEKKSGNFVEGYAFVLAEYASPDGAKYLITSHGKRDWDGAVSSIKSATYFKARLMTSKRFDIFHTLNKAARLVSLKLVAKDSLTGQTVVEEINPRVQTDVLGF